MGMSQMLEQLIYCSGMCPPPVSQRYPSLSMASAYDSAAAAVPSFYPQSNNTNVNQMTPALCYPNQAYENEPDVGLAPEHKIKIYDVPAAEDDYPKTYVCLHTSEQDEFVQICKDDITHLIVDLNEKYCPAEYKQIMTVVLYSYNKEISMPIFSALLTKTESQAYRSVLKEFKKICDSVALRPTYVTFPFDPSVFSLCARIFAKSTFIASFYFYAQSLWKMAYTCGLQKEAKYDVHRLLFKLKALAFAPHDRVLEDYAKVVEVFARRSMSQIFPLSLEFFEKYRRTFVDGDCRITNWVLSKYTNHKAQYTTPVLVATNLVKQYLLLAEKAWLSCVESKDEIIVKIGVEYKAAIARKVKFPNESDKLLAHFLKFCATASTSPEPEETQPEFVPYTEQDYLLGIVPTESPPAESTPAKDQTKKPDPVQAPIQTQTQESKPDPEYDKQLTDFKDSLRSYFADDQIQDQIISQQQNNNVDKKSANSNDGENNVRTAVTNNESQETSSQKAGSGSDSNSPMVLGAQKESEGRCGLILKKG